MAMTKHILTALFLLAGCNAGSDGQPAAPSAAQPETANQPAEQVPGQEAESPPKQILITGSAGLDGYPAGSAFDISLVRQALPEYEVVEGLDGSEGEEWAVFHVMDQGAVVLQVDPDFDRTGLGSLRTSSELVATTTGHGVGSEFGWIFTEDEPDCLPGREEMSGLVICPAPGSQTFYYIFEGSWKGPDGEVPPLQELEQWKVKTVVWVPVPG
jgi:Protein of unknown function (DUF1131)